MKPWGSAVDGPPTSVRDANTLNHDRQAAAGPHGLDHHNCKLSEQKVGEHLGREAARYEQVLRETTRGTSELFKGPALFAAKTRHQGRGRLIIWSTAHITSTQPSCPSLLAVDE